MSAQRQNDRASYDMLPLSETETQSAPPRVEETGLEENLLPPIGLFETSKSLFDLALASGFRLLGAG
jgi:hypothetical protein